MLQVFQAEVGSSGPFLFGRPVAVLIGLAALQVLQAVQLVDGWIRICQLQLLLVQRLTPLHQTRQCHLFLIREQINPANVLQVKAQQIRRAAAAASVTGLPCAWGLRWQRQSISGL